jgi:hypothetical protein
MSRDNSGEDGLGLGLGFNGEDDYYDSLTSDDEGNGNQPIRNRTFTPVEPVFNPEPGIDDKWNAAASPTLNQEETGEHENHSPAASNEANFTTIINGVKIKSLPGPRGASGLRGQKGEPGEKGDMGRDGLNGVDGPPGPSGHVFMVPVSSFVIVKSPQLISS